MDGGVGEAALLSAAIGGGTSALMGGDPLKGALMGGLTGGAMGFINPASALEAGTATLSTEAQQELAKNMAAMQASGASNADMANILKQYGYGENQISRALTPSEAGFDLGAPEGTYATMTPKASNALGIGNLTNKQLAMTAGIGGLSALMGAKPNYMERFQPKTAAQSGMPTATLAANYQPWRPRYYAAGGDVQSNIPPLEIGPGSVPTRGVAPYSLSPQQDQNQGLTMQDLQGIAQQYGYSIPGMADGGIAGLDHNSNFPMALQQASRYAVPSQMPVGATDIRMGTMAPTPMARGGIADLGGYSDGGRMLKGPGDGMSDSIPASIGGKQPARLADGEFVVPADVVSHLGNGSTDAGAKQLYSMMDKVRKARTGTKKQGKEINPNKYVPA